MSHKHIKVSQPKANNCIKNHQIKQERKATLSLSLEAYDLYIFSPFGNKLPKSSKMHSAIRHSKHDLRELRNVKMAWREQHLQKLRLASEELEGLPLEGQLRLWLLELKL